MVIYLAVMIVHMRHIIFEELYPITKASEQGLMNTQTSVTPKYEQLTKNSAVAYVAPKQTVNSRAKTRVVTAVDGRMNERTNEWMENWIPVSCNASSKRDKKA